MNHPSSTADLRFFDPRSEIDCGKNRLPHWQQRGGTVFISFRLADSIPQERLREWELDRESCRNRNPPPWSANQEREYHTRFSSRVESWCDRGTGSCALRQPDIRAVVCKALAHFDGERHWHHAFVVMPNHVHALFSLFDTDALADVVKSWKGFAAREVHRLTAESGRFWMKDYFDRLVRDAAHFWRCARYIRRNPEKAGLTPHEFTLFEAPFVRQCLDTEAGVRNGGFPAAEARSTDRSRATGKSPLR